MILSLMTAYVLVKFDAFSHDKFNRCESLYKQERFDEASKACIKNSSSNPINQYYLALMFKLGYGVKKDKKRFLSLITKSALSGFAKSQYSLATYYAKNSDYNKALMWYKKSSSTIPLSNIRMIEIYLARISNHSKKTDLNALISLLYSDQFKGPLKQVLQAYVTSKGIGVPKDVKKALRMYGDLKNEVVDSGMSQSLEKVKTLFSNENFLSFYKRNYGLSLFMTKNSLKEAYRLLESADKTSDSLYTLGVMRLNGMGVQRNILLAKAWLRSAIKKNNTSAMVELSTLLMTESNPDYQRAVLLLNRAAKLKSSTAMQLLGDLYASGVGVPLDLELAKRWYQEASDLGNVLAKKKLQSLIKQLGKKIIKDTYCSDNIQNIFHLYRTKRLTVYNSKRVAEWFSGCQRDAKADNPRMLYIVGMLYIRGILVKQNVKKGLSFVKKSASLGYATAMHRLAQIYTWGICHTCKSYRSQSSSVVVKKNYKEAIKFILQYLNSYEADYYNISRSLCNAAVWLLFGYGVEVDFDRGLEYALIASQHNSSRCSSILGDIYSKGRFGQTVDIKKAIFYYKKSLKNNNKYHRYVIRRLCQLYFNNYAKNPDSALKWCRQSARLKNKYSMYDLSQMLLDSRFRGANTQEGMKWLKKSAKMGYSPALRALKSYPGNTSSVD